MMLYVFHVDCGRMLKFDMNLALSSVQSLKETIERMHGYPAGNQILLVSGGEILLPGSLVCSYSAGTDTNPIYMFTTVESKSQLQPWPSIEHDLSEQVQKTHHLPASYATVVARAQLAQQFYDIAKEEEKICEQLVHEQHLQQQGWSAVIANMEDLTDEFKQRFDNFSKCFDEHIARQDNYKQFIELFNEDLDKLSSIPILPSLMPNAEQEFHAFDEYFENDEVFTTSDSKTASTESKKKRDMIQSTTSQQSSPDDDSGESNQQSSFEKQKNSYLTLLQWISAKENYKSLKLMAEECARGLDLFDDKTIKDLKQKVTTTIKQAQQEEIKAIKGLEDRLSGLEKLMYDIKMIVQDQKELALGFQQNQARASNLGDPSILPDLCTSHQGQLKVMLGNQKNIHDVRRRISKAKEELAQNLYKRLRFIIHIENNMSELDNRLLFYHRCLRRVQRHINIIEQIHQTPSIYVLAVIEVVRRRFFSNFFSIWSTDLACDMLAIYNDEIMRRQEFSSVFEGHFLNTLFPGMDDVPAPFATETPPSFDTSLPSLTKSDIDILSNYLPELTSKMQLPDMAPVIDFFSSRSGNKTNVSVSEEKTAIVSAVDPVCSAAAAIRPLDIHAHLKDEFESETDTEEFEKVGQSPNERKNEQTTVASTSTSTSCHETATTGTTTDVVPTKNTETLTEISSYSPPKKPSRLMRTSNVSRSLELALPAIPESLSSNGSESSRSSSADSVNQIAVSKHSNESSICCYSEPKENAEFINSEFYIDESLGSSALDDDTSSSPSTSKEEQLGDYLRMKRTSVKQCLVERFSKRHSTDSNELARDDETHKFFDNTNALETVIKLLQENLGTTAAEAEKFRYLLFQMSHIAKQSLTLLKSELKSVRECTELERNKVQKEFDELSKTFTELKTETKRNEQEIVQRMTIDHELELNDVRKCLTLKEDELQHLKSDRNFIETNHMEILSNYQRERDDLCNETVELKAVIADLESKLKFKEDKTEKAVKQARDTLIREHKTEMESLRCRFKLMTSMERSPSDTSLEKIERPDMIEIACHESILSQIRADMQAEKEEAIKQAVEQERMRWAALKSPTSSPTVSKDVFKLVLDEKEKQIDCLRARDEILTKQNNDLLLKVESLANQEQMDRSILEEKIDILTKTNCILGQELNVEKSKRLEMESSVSTIKGLSTSSREKGSSVRQRIGVSTDSCAKNDLVFIVWNPKHRQYTIFQDSPILYFLHAESYNALNLKTPEIGDTNIPSLFFCLGQVIEKEYCLARKDENRYRVLRGTKFYRVKVAQVSKVTDSSPRSSDRIRERQESTSSTQIVPVSRSTSTQHLMDSFAQTELSNAGAAGDMVDSGVAVHSRGEFKERNISVSEEEEPISLLTEKYRYVSVSEEDERTIDASVIQDDSTTNVLQLQLLDISLEKQDQDDSDEYRSLEAKDDLVEITDTAN